MKNSIKKIIISLLLVFLLMLTSCDLISSGSESINGECEIEYQYENEQRLINEFNISEILLKITENGETYYVAVTEDMISDSDFEKLSTVGTHVIAIGYRGFIGEVTVVLVEEICYDTITYKVINPYDNIQVQIKDFKLENIKIEVNTNGNITYVNLSEELLEDSDISKLKNIGKHSISFKYNENVLNFTVEIINSINQDGYTYDKENTKSKLKVSDLNLVYEDKEYTNYLDVCSYIYHFHKLPSNYLTKKQAEALGWSGSGNNVWQNASLRGKLIGGDTFYNNEGNLPSVTGYAYIEVDVNCSNGRRGAHRIVYNKYTWDIYYTSDHYDSFVYLIGKLE